MLDRAEMAHAKMVDSLKVLVPSGAVLGVVSVAGLTSILSLALVILNIGYLVWRWRKDALKRS